MTDLARKPPARMESRDPHSIRFNDAEWGAIADEARRRGIEPSRFARKLCLTGLSMLRTQAAMEADTWRTA
jgi:hypothetical protein